MNKLSILKKGMSVLLLSTLLVSCDTSVEATKIDSTKTVVTNSVSNSNSSVSNSNSSVSNNSSISSQGTNESKPIPGQFKGTMSDVKIIDSEGKEVSLIEATKGKKTILVFYTSWCSDCRLRVPYLNNSYSKNKDKVNYIFINVTDNQNRETRESGMKYHKGNFYQFPYYSLDSKDSNLTIGVSRIPAVLAFNEKGILIDYMIETFTQEETDAFVKKLVDSKTSGQ